jgi:hypothetical protein
MNARDRSPNAGTGVLRGTGRERADWFAALDAWGAAGRPYKEIAGWLVDEHGLSAWWAQKITVEYEQARGARAPGVRRDGTFTVTASKAVAVPIERLLAAFSDPALRAPWLPAVHLEQRDGQPGRVLRFELAGRERLEATFLPKGADRSEVALEHSKLPDGATADDARAAWRERLGVLKATLER